ncbi:hypothetical protein [Labilibacter marinus]|uniref:hypothetical protein n=1 Tax=Labilibacter marinus TaxID=1477105 RepID=UPI000835AC39|nr:hypothetical protein [Labilibacter marinus]
MKYIFVLLLLISFAKSYAHTDKHFTYKFDKVTVRFKTGFMFEEINNARIIGEYASLLCNHLNYNEPVFLDFIHDYGNSYKGHNFSFMNIGKGSYRSKSYFTSVHDSTLNADVYQMVPYSMLNELDQNNINKEIYSIEPTDSLEKIVIRQFGFHFEVNNTLNLLHYAISNLNEVVNSAKQDSLCSYLPNMYYEFNTISKLKIDSIKALKIKDVEQVMQQKVYAKEGSVTTSQLSYSYFAKNNTYFIFAAHQENEVVLDTLSQIYSINLITDNLQTLFVFETPYSFKSYEEVGFDNEFKKSKLHKLPIERDEAIVFYNVNWILDDIYFINLIDSFTMSPSKIYPYLLNEDILIPDFENYINSNRRNTNNNGQ